MSASKESQILTTNQVLAALPRQEYAFLFSHLEPVHLPRSKILYDFADPISSAFFMMSRMVSLLSITEDGSTTQVSMVGNEGVVGIAAQLRVGKAPYRIIRGNIEIIDRQGLETTACECYRIVTEEIGCLRAA